MEMIEVMRYNLTLVFEPDPDGAMLLTVRNFQNL